ncbi:uncharacterized protein B0J16DRAFT_394718 [Fusarium flagelliforme]|uniref:uncharacterized protein n=1 Tax=Fusarium flagelliforme TaxID=2675880 RepID=UPI001E8E4462|nr:uncharacterized protein B0J16DRAFT_394718 [Fusarium flagelliforme]KAH7192762.1 hypothetical protein B0J16DRAFT_394718 [Fusarium flagelliforme]
MSLNPVIMWHIMNNRNANIKVTINSETYDKKAIYLTDARRTGIMLRDSRLTLRDHSALTRFVVEAVGDNQFILQVPAMQDDNCYVFTANKGAFHAKASRDKAQRFQFQITELGLELFLEGDRPVVFDDYHDVSIGKFEKGRSNIPILVHEDISSIWLTPAQTQTTQRTWEVPMAQNQQQGEGTSNRDIPPWVRQGLMSAMNY